jgi:hypothetical protein
MAGVRFTTLQSRPREFLDFTSLTLDEFQQLVAVYLHTADKYRRSTRRPPQGQKGLDERARMVSSRPFHPWRRPQSRPCGRTSPMQAFSPCCFPPLLCTHTPAGCGQGGTRNNNTSRNVQTWSVSPAAMAGVEHCHCWAEPVPWVGRGCGNGTRKLA